MPALDWTPSRLYSNFATRPAPTGPRLSDRSATSPQGTAEQVREPPCMVKLRFAQRFGVRIGRGERRRTGKDGWGASIRSPAEIARQANVDDMAEYLRGPTWVGQPGGA
uniref:Uncharacterized protein n=1 Tax=Trichuris muris TaxID=70415 RepID=A0A5S6R5Q9_TRIMR